MFRISEIIVYLRENVVVLMYLFRVIFGMMLFFGVVWNKKYFRKFENDNYIFRYLIFF